ncbi:MAG: cytochrome c3 family protein [Acidobacteriota bacterium]|nr:cytochrome c3 family protein [Acidobacteriota bacterium]
MFEHGSSLVEGCTTCHDPHGSPNRRQLIFQSTADLCHSCHATVPGFHIRFRPDTQCTNCHSAIHASNLSPYFLK